MIRLNETCLGIRNVVDITNSGQRYLQRWIVPLRGFHEVGNGVQCRSESELWTKRVELFDTGVCLVMPLGVGCQFLGGDEQYHRPVATG